MKNTEIEPGTRRWHRHRLAAWVLTGATVLALIIMSILGGGPAHAQSEHPTPVTFTRVHGPVYTSQPAR